MIAAALWYGIFIKESYVPYKDSGIIMDGSTLNVTEDYYGVYGSTAPDQETVFLYLSSTVYTRHHSIDKPETIMDFGGVSSIETDEKGYTVKYSTKEVYYVPEKYAKEFKLTGHEREGISFPSNAEKAETATADIKKQSVLIWKAAN